MRLNKILAALAAIVILISCGKKEDEPITPTNADFNGTVSVIFNGSPFDNENIDVNFTPSEDGKTASITIYKIRFVPQMPVTIDVTIPNVNVMVSGEVMSLSKDHVVPLAMGGEYPRYTVTGLKGKIVGDEMSFSLNFGDYPTSFTGRKKI